MFLEEKLLKELFNLNGILCTGGNCDFDFQLEYHGGYAIIKLNEDKAELYLGRDCILEDIRKLSKEQILALKDEGYNW